MSTSDNLNGSKYNKLKGDDARRLLKEQIKAHSDGILTSLSEYQAADTVRTWHATIRGIEEFINIPLFGIDSNSDKRKLLAFRLDEAFMQNPIPGLFAVKAILTSYVDKNSADRFCFLMLQIAAIRIAFAINGKSEFGASITLDSIAEAIKYLQSRRRHFVSLLYLMPYACKGSEKISSKNTLNILLPIVEHSCITITGLYLKLAMIDIVPDFTLEINEAGARASHWPQILDAGFLDPERASIMAMNELRRDKISLPDLEQMDSGKIFSAAELRNSIKLLSATYADFGLHDSDFATMADIVTKLSSRCHDDYVVAISIPRLRTLLNSYSCMNSNDLERLLVNKPSTQYAPNTNAFEPFVEVAGVAISNVNLLSRFLYNFKNIHLESRRRFQIHAGFIFEDMVKHDLKKIGFNITDIKRLNRKEFDVVATHGDVIYNFQCKNNWIDLTKVESNLALYVRYNRTLVNYYTKALAKEVRREGLLKNKLGLNIVEHRIISRFPVISTNGLIVSYNRIGELVSLLRE